ncbi:hypothetical protein GCM10010304_01880 [Streptomyces roseoviolaceus]
MAKALSEVFLERQRADGLRIGLGVEERCVAGGQVQASGLGLARARGEVDPVVAADGGLVLQMGDDAPGAAPERGVVSEPSWVAAMPRNSTGMGMAFLKSGDDTPSSDGDTAGHALGAAGCDGASGRGEPGGEQV